MRHCFSLYPFEWDFALSLNFGFPLIFFDCIINPTRLARIIKEWNIAISTFSSNICKGLVWMTEKGSSGSEISFRWRQSTHFDNFKPTNLRKFIGYHKTGCPWQISMEKTPNWLVLQARFGLVTLLSEHKSFWFASLLIYFKFRNLLSLRDILELIFLSLFQQNKQILIDAVVHAVNEDYVEMANDFTRLGFLASGTDVTPIVPALEAIWQNSAGKGLSDFNFRSVTGKLCVQFLFCSFSF